jgi:prolyl 4-hydroxylase
MSSVKVVEKFLSEEECKYLIDFAVSLNIWEDAGGGFWDGRVVNYKTVLANDKHAAKIMINFHLRCKELIEKEMIDTGEIYSDLLQLIRWFPGMSQSTHADDMSNTDAQGFDHRAFGSVLYLNDNYNGGHTYYPNINFEITPKTGSLAIHKGDVEHLHGVTEVKDNMRYTIASFWTKERSKSYDWSVYE